METITMTATIAHLMSDHEVNTVLRIETGDEEEHLKFDRESIKNWAERAERLPYKISAAFDPKKKLIILEAS